MSEEDQMMRAIAMSLGQDIPMDQRAESPEVLWGRLGSPWGGPSPPPSSHLSSPISLRSPYLPPLRLHFTSLRPTLHPRLTP